MKNKPFYEDIFVRIKLDVEEKETKFETSTKKSNTGPVYNESFEFNLAPFQVEYAKLSIFVYSKRLFSSKVLIGSILFDDKFSHEEYIQHLKEAITKDGEMVIKMHSLLTQN
jgi:Ca2+-dependent lipid-binding protein